MLVIVVVFFNYIIFFIYYFYKIMKVGLIKVLKFLFYENLLNKVYGLRGFFVYG